MVSRSLFFLPSFGCIRLRPLILCALAALLSVANSGIAEPYLPESDNEVLERLTNKPLDPQARELSSLQAQLARNPQELTNAVQLARRYIERARADSDPRYLGYAQAALDRIQLQASTNDARGELPEPLRTKTERHPGKWVAIVDNAIVAVDPSPSWRRRNPDARLYFVTPTT